MSDQQPIGDVIAAAIFSAYRNYRPPGADPGVTAPEHWIGAEEARHFTGAILVALDEAGYVVVPKHTAGL